MASNLIAMGSTLVAMASNLLAMASTYLTYVALSQGEKICLAESACVYLSFDQGGRGSKNGK